MCLFVNSPVGFTDNNLRPFVHYGALTGHQHWRPDSALIREDADVSLFVLSANNVKYSVPVDDPIFKASRSKLTGPGNGPLAPGTPPSEEEAVNQPDAVVAVLGCTDQHQFCIASGCTPLTAYGAALSASDNLGMNPMQKAIKDRLGKSLSLYSIYSSVKWLGGNALRASDTVLDHLQGPLPDNQWTIEVSAWMATSLARLQQVAVEYSGGISSATDGVTQIPADSPEEKTMCRSQKVRNTTGTVSFSVLGLLLILVIGTIIITISLSLSTIVGRWRSFKRSNEFKQLQWILDDILQLYRLAYEEAGQGRWVYRGDSVPVTKVGDVIGIPEDANKDHPRLRSSISPQKKSSEQLEMDSLIGDGNSRTTGESTAY